MSQAVPSPRITSAPRCVWPAGATLGEGTLWSPGEGVLYWVDILGRELYRYTPSTGEQARWSFDEEISSLAERRHAPGLTVTLRSGFAHFDPASGALTRLHDPEADQPGNRFNDGKCDAAGRYWAGTMDFDATRPSGSLYRFDSDGACQRVDSGYAVSNGPTWSADGRTLYFNDTVNQQVNAFDFDVETGTVSNKRPWLKLARGDGYPDGMTTDAAGRLWICHWGGACVTCHDPVSGAELARIGLPTAHITNVAFGGPDLRTLFITSARYELSAEQLAEQPLAGSLFAVELDSPGCAPHKFAG